MPAPIVFTRRRWLMLQLSMAVLFVLTLALAAAVRSVRIGAAGVPLDKTVGVDGVIIRIPSRWEAETRALPHGIPGAGIAAAESADLTKGTFGRSIEIRVEELEKKETAASYLARRFDFPPGAEMTKIQIAGLPGMQTRRPGLVTGNDYSGVASHLYACVILPDLKAVTIHLQIPGREPDSKDLALLDGLAAGIEFTDGADGGDGGDRGDRGDRGDD